VIERFCGLSPGTTACFVDDLEAFLARLKPPRHRINLRIHRPHRAQLRRRTAAHQGDPSRHRQEVGDEAQFATLIRASERWCRVSINDLERQQLRLLCRELGIDP
jgi:hypothetical protein